MELSVSCCCSVTQSCPTLCDPMNSSMPGFLSFTMFRSLLKFMSILSVMLANSFILCCPLLLLPSIFPSARVFCIFQHFIKSLNLLLCRVRDRLECLYVSVHGKVLRPDFWQALISAHLRGDLLFFRASYCPVALPVQPAGGRRMGTALTAIRSCSTPGVSEWQHPQGIRAKEQECWLQKQGSENLEGITGITYSWNIRGFDICFKSVNQNSLCKNPCRNQYFFSSSPGELCIRNTAHCPVSTTGVSEMFHGCLIHTTRVETDEGFTAQN